MRYTKSEVLVQKNIFEHVVNQINDTFLYRNKLISRDPQDHLFKGRFEALSQTRIPETCPVVFIWKDRESSYDVVSKEKSM